jgi:hypothetical protein
LATNDPVPPILFSSLICPTDAVRGKQEVGFFERFFVLRSKLDVVVPYDAVLDLVIIPDDKKDRVLLFMNLGK